jgi:transcriptional regulator with XRE-family HTH domain
MTAQQPTARALFARNLKELRYSRGFKGARQFAHALQIDENRYPRYERGEVEPSLSMLVRICEALGVTPNELLRAQAPQPAISAGTAAGGLDIRAAGPPCGLRTKKAIAWNLARDIALAGAGLPERPGEAKTCGVLRRASALFHEIDSDLASFVTHPADMPEVAALDPDNQQRIADQIGLLLGDAPG